MYKKKKVNLFVLVSINYWEIKVMCIAKHVLFSRYRLRSPMLRFSYFFHDFLLLYLWRFSSLELFRLWRSYPCWQHTLVQIFLALCRIFFHSQIWTFLYVVESNCYFLDARILGLFRAQSFVSECGFELLLLLLPLLFVNCLKHRLIHVLVWIAFGQRTKK